VAGRNATPFFVHEFAEQAHKTCGLPRMVAGANAWRKEVLSHHPPTSPTIPRWTESLTLKIIQPCGRMTLDYSVKFKQS
jgi:hypothetical protein